MSVTPLRSEYYNIASFQPTIEASVDDILVQTVEANSVSDSSISFQIRQPGINSLMDSEVLLFLPCRVYPQRPDAAGIVDVQPESEATEKMHDQYQLPSAANVGDLEAASTLKIRDVGKNFSFCRRWGGVVKALQSITVDLNNTFHFDETG